MRKYIPLYLTWLGIFLGQFGNLVPSVSAQVLVNGQVFTQGLAILDSPAPNSKMHAGSSFTIAVDVSGNGKLSQPDFNTTGIDSLNIYLVSSQTSLNLTVVTSPEFLEQEQGSTVKHYNSPIPQCVPSGPYNVTLYELGHIAGAEYFSITAIPITVQNASPSGSCSSLNDLQAQPQPSSPPPQNPLLSLSAQPVSFPQANSSSSGPVPPLTLVPVPSQSGMKTMPSSRQTSQATQLPASSGLGVLTLTLGPSSVQWPLVITPPGMTVPIVVEPSGLTAPDIVTLSGDVSETAMNEVPQTASDSGVGDGTVVVVVTPTFTPTPVTVVFVTVETVTRTSTEPGITSVYTTAQTSYTTTTGILGMPTDATDSSNAGFLPINAVSAGSSLYTSLIWTIAIPVLFFVAC